MKSKRTIFYFVISLLFLFVFVAIYGYINFDINYTDWCLIKHNHTNSTDININYLNFFAFLNDSSGIPYYQDMIYPYRGSALFIDYIPILAIITKIFYRYILNINSVVSVQYVWYFGAFAFVLQGLVSFKLIKKITNASDIVVFISSIFFVLAPPLIFRFPFHYTLCAQFLVLLSFYPFAFKYTKKQLALFCFLLGFLSSLIFIYFLPFLLINIGGYILYKCIKKESILYNISLYPIMLFGALIPFLIAHGGHIDLIPYGTGYGYFSTNLNTFINPINMYGLFKSNLFPFLNNLQLCFRDQNEGFAYLGGGIIVLIIFSLICLFKKYKLSEIKQFIEKYNIEFIIFALIFFITFFISTSFKITLNENILFEMNIPQELEILFSIFRTTGRYVWNDFYLIYLILFIFLIKNFDKNKLIIILLTGLILQIYDLVPAFKILNNEYQTKVTYKNPLFEDVIWNSLKKDKKQIVVFNFYPFEYVDFAHYAIVNKLKMNNLQLSRDVEYSRFYDYQQYVYNNLQDNILYVFAPEDTLYINQKTNLKYCYLLSNGYIACTKQKDKTYKSIELRDDKKLDESDYQKNSEAYRYLMGYGVNNENISSNQRDRYRY